MRYYIPKRRRLTSDVDIALHKNSIANMIKKLKEKGCNVYYNSSLNEFSARIFCDGEPVHIDIYPGKIDVYNFDEMFFERRTNLQNPQFAWPLLRIYL